MTSLNETSDKPISFTSQVQTERLAATALFCTTFLYIWVSLTPFPDLTYSVKGAAASIGSNAINQVVVVALVTTLVGYALATRSAAMVLRPRTVLFVLFVWMFLVSVPAPDPGFAVRRLVMAFIVCVAASIFLTLPKDEQHFARMVAACSGIILALCYLGVMLFPRYAVHQFTDELEPMLEGDWRGLFAHKNTAGAAMVIIVFLGFYVGRALGVLYGLPIVLLAVLFLILSGSKTSAALLPVTMAVAFVLVRVPYIRLLTSAGTLATLGFFTIGSALSERVAGMVSAVGIDATFTRRAEIWILALEHIPKRLWTGYGYQSFWRNADLMHSFREEFNWAVTAADAHNGYLDILLMAGVPGLIAAAILLLFLPVRYIARAERNGGERRLTELFVRIWFFGMLVACLESILFATNGALWFMMLIAIFGLRLQAKAILRRTRTHPP